MATTRKPYDLLVWLGLALTAVFISRYSPIDWQVASYFHGNEAGGFPLRNNAFWLMAHSLTRGLSAVMWLALLAFTVHQYSVKQTTAFYAGRFILLTSLWALAINGLLKTHSVHSCPWSLAAFGGHSAFFRLLDPVPIDAGSGGCFPSGHAAVGFMWWPVVYACALWRPRLTRHAGVAVAVFGALCGAIQIVRGAHFVSHVVMTAAVTGACTSLAFHMYLRMRAEQPPAIPSLLT